MTSPLRRLPALAAHRWTAAWLWLALLALALVPSATHLRPPHPGWSVAFLAGFLLSHAAALAAALVLGASLLALSFRGAPARLCSAFVASGLVTFVAVDATVYGLLGLHLDRTTFGNLLQPQALEILGLEWGDVARTLALSGVGLALSFLACRGLPTPRAAATLFTAAVLCDVGFSAAAIGARFQGVQPVIGLAEAMPLAWSPRPDVLARWFGNPPRAIEDDLQFPASVQLRPERLTLRPAELSRRSTSRPNVLVLTVESLRPDGLEAMPHLRALAEGSLVSPRHYSSGNCSFLGVFSLLSGLSALYWSVDDTQRSPRGVGAFASLGYELAVRHSAALNFGIEAKTLPPGTVVPAAAAGVLERDAATADWLSAWVRAAHSRPWLVAAFFDGSHWPYSAPGLPAISINLGESWALRDRVGELKDRYRRSLAQVDAQLGRVFTALRESGQWDSTVVVVVGDHGEAFLEHGVLMHGSRVDEEQIRTAWILKLPGRSAGTLEGRTFQQDVLPTVLGSLGAGPWPATVGGGVDALRPEPRELPPAIGSCGISIPVGYAAFLGEEKILFQLDRRGARYIGSLAPGDIQRAYQPPTPEVQALLDAQATSLHRWTSPTP